MYIDIGWILKGVEIFSLLLIALGILRLVVLKRNDHERERRIYSSSFVKSWNSPELLEGNRILLLSRRDWRKLNFEQFEKLIEEDHDAYFRVITLLNFFEELAQSIEYGLSDEDSLKSYFLATVDSTYTTFERFIEYMRERSHSPYLFTSFEKMVYRWQRPPSKERHY